MSTTNQNPETEQNNDFTQLCVWPETLMNETETEPTQEEIDRLVEFFQENFGTRIKFDTVVKTLPDLDRFDNPIPETGGRSDIFFYVHSDDIGKFAGPRLSVGIRWWEDVIKYNDTSRHLYTKEFIEARPVTW